MLLGHHSENLCESIDSKGIWKGIKNNWVHVDRNFGGGQSRVTSSAYLNLFMARYQCTNQAGIKLVFLMIVILLFCFLLEIVIGGGCLYSEHLVCLWPWKILFCWAGQPNLVFLKAPFNNHKKRDLDLYGFYHFSCCLWDLDLIRRSYLNYTIIISFVLVVCNFPFSV